MYCTHVGKPARNDASPAFELLEFRVGLVSHLSLTRRIYGICYVEHWQIPRNTKLIYFAFLPAHGVGIVERIRSFKL